MRAVAARFQTFIGVDLGGGKGKRTALAVLRRQDDVASVALLAPMTGAAPLYDTALVDLIRAQGEGALLCVDAPLTLPPCLRCVVPVCPGQSACVDPEVVQMHRLARPREQEARDVRRGKPTVTPYTQRATEIYLNQVVGIRPLETLGQGMGPLTSRAVHLVRALADRFGLNNNLIEVYPRATLELLGLSDFYKKREDVRLGMLARLPELTFAPGVWREECVRSDHLFDAVICAYTGFLFARDGWQLPADAPPLQQIAGGWIWTPPDKRTRRGAADVNAAPVR